MRKIIRRKALRDRVPYSDTQIWRMEKAGSFPQRVRLSEGGTVGWYEDEVDQWIAARVRAVGRRPSAAATAA